MKTKTFRLLILATALCLSTLIGCTGSTEKNTTEEQVQNADTKYTCSMHPEIIKDKPGDCPICGMELVEKQ